MTGLAITVAADLVWLAFNLFMIRVGIDYLAVLWEFPAIMPALRINQFYPHSIVVIDDKNGCLQHMLHMLRRRCL